MDQDYFMEDGVVSPASHWSGGEQVFMEHMPHFDSSLSSMIMRLGGGDGGGAAAFPGYATAAALFPGDGNLSPSMPHVSSDPAFAGRAAKFSCYGSQSFNGRTANDMESTRLRSPAPLMGSAKLSRVCSSPSLRQGGSPPNFMKTHMKLGRIQGIADNTNEDSSVSDQMPSSNEMNSRKRKTKTSDDANAKRLKAAETVKNDTRAEEEEEEQKANQKKPPEPPKDYIHVRARRGQATDSHSLAERVRREKISERMKLLQDLVPGCNKVTGKALMLDEIINYVQSLQRQVEFLSMKLATVNPGLDFDTQKIPQQMYPSNSSFFHQDVQQLHENRGTLGIHLPSADGFTHNLPQLPAFNEDDLHSIVQMGLAQNPSTFPSTNHSTGMKDER